MLIESNMQISNVFAFFSVLIKSMEIELEGSRDTPRKYLSCFLLLAHWKFQFFLFAMLVLLVVASAQYLYGAGYRGVGYGYPAYGGYAGYGGYRGVYYG
uniref:Uncharacterized protein n=1 Tax=Strigamia maritima TaxID=126957 RepID=T1JJZ9_STRMM